MTLLCYVMQREEEVKMSFHQIRGQLVWVAWNKQHNQFLK